MENEKDYGACCICGQPAKYYYHEDCPTCGSLTCDLQIQESIDKFEENR